MENLLLLSGAYFVWKFSGLFRFTSTDKHWKWFNQGKLNSFAKKIIAILVNERLDNFFNSPMWVEKVKTAVVSSFKSLATKLPVAFQLIKSLLSRIDHKKLGLNAVWHNRTRFWPELTSWSGVRKQERTQMRVSTSRKPWMWWLI